MQATQTPKPNKIVNITLYNTYDGSEIENIMENQNVPKNIHQTLYDNIWGVLYSVPLEISYDEKGNITKVEVKAKL